MSKTKKEKGITKMSKRVKSKKGKMSKQVLLTLARCANEVYSESISLGGGLDVWPSIHRGPGGLYKVLAFAGSNDGWDWVRNLDIRSKQGLKRSSLVSAKKVFKTDLYMGLNIPLYVTGHSLGASRAIAYADLFDVAGGAFFNPPPTIQKGRLSILDHCTLLRDPDDPVDQVGHTWFDHPVCPTITREDDHIGYRVSEHSMDRWIPFIKEIKMKKKNDGFPMMPDMKRREKIIKMEGLPWAIPTPKVDRVIKQIVEDSRR